LRTTQQTREFYADWAESYDQEIGVESDYRQPERCAITLAGVVDDKTLPILDIGCGTGLSGLALKKAGFEQISGCDLSKEMLTKAKNTGCYDNLFETDLNRPPIDVKADSFAAITAVGVFSFGHVKPDAMDEFLRILKVGGKIVVGINDHYYDEGTFPQKIEKLVDEGKIAILSRQHGLHLKNVKDSTGWVIVGEKIST